MWRPTNMLPLTSPTQTPLAYDAWGYKWVLKGDDRDHYCEGGRYYHVKCNPCREAYLGKGAARVEYDVMEVAV